MDKGIKIALVELAMHNEVVSNYSRILLAGGFDITLCTNRFIYNQLGIIREQVKWVLQDPEENNIQFAERIKPKLNAFDLVIFTTIENNIRYFKNFSIIPPKALVVHKLNMFINPNKQFLFNEDLKQRLKDIIKIFRYQFLNERKLFLNFIKGFDHLIFPSKSVQQYFIQQQWDVDLPTHSVVDFAVHEQEMFPPPTPGLINITIPGIISSKSRDYEVVLEAFQNIRLSQNVHLSLLGQPKGRYGQRIVQGFTTLNNPQLSIQCYDQFVDQTEFDRVLQQSDFLILPISRFMKVSIFKELNGYTCVSGNINDMMRFGIPSIIADYYPIDREMQTLTSTFQNAEQLKGLVESWVDAKIYIAKRKELGTVLFPYKVEELADRVKEEMGRLLE